MLRLGEPLGYAEVVHLVPSPGSGPTNTSSGSLSSTQDNYGPGFSTFCRPFIATGLDPYVAARVANLAALAGAVGILAGILRANRVSWVNTGAVASIFFALNAGSSSIQARPDFLATLLIMAALAAGQPRASSGASAPRRPASSWAPWAWPGSSPSPIACSRGGRPPPSLLSRRGPSDALGGHWP